MNSMEFQHENALNLKKGRTLERAKVSTDIENTAPICKTPAQMRAFTRALLNVLR